MAEMQRKILQHYRLGAIPALLYYLGIIIQVQLRASKDGLVGLLERSTSFY